MLRHSGPQCLHGFTKVTKFCEDLFSGCVFALPKVVYEHKNEEIGGPDSLMNGRQRQRPFNFVVRGWKSPSILQSLFVVEKQG